MTLRTVLHLALFLTLCTSAESCILCWTRIPPRPRPIDQFQLPKLPKGVNFEQRPQLCAATEDLPVGGLCKQGFSKLFCGADRFVDGLMTSCKDENSLDECVSCNERKANDFWIVKWFDSLGKPPAGVSDGNYYWLGDYQICLELNEQQRFDGKYCRVELAVPDSLVEVGCPQTDPLKIILGACLPVNCSDAELEILAETYTPYETHVECELPHPLTTLAQVFIGCCAAWIFIVAVATIMEVLSPNLGFAKAFSLRVNGQRALSTKREHRFHAIQGMEVLSFVLFVVGDVYNYMLPYIENVAFSFESVGDPITHVFTNNVSFHVDGLLALSALFASLSLIGRLKEIRDIPVLLWRRFVGIWPVYALIVAFMSIVFGESASGPLYIHGDTTNRCAESWWKNLLFINDFFSARSTCVDFGYVLALEAQYFVILLLLLWLGRCFDSRLSQIISAIVGLLSIVFVFVFVNGHDVPPVPVLTAEPLNDTAIETLLDGVIVSPWGRASAYFLALAASFFFSSIKPESKLPGWLTLILTTAIIIMGAFVLTGILPYCAQSVVIDGIVGARLYLAFYAALHRPLWALALLILLYICNRGALKPIDSFLAWRIFSPLSKLNYSALLLSEPVIVYLFSSLHRPTHATHWGTIYTSVSSVVLCYMIAFFLDVFISRPLRNLLIPQRKFDHTFDELPQSATHPSKKDSSSSDN